jgi:hypothetical protein
LRGSDWPPNQAMMPRTGEYFAMGNPFNVAAEELKVRPEITLAPKLWRKR